MAIFNTILNKYIAAILFCGLAIGFFYSCSESGQTEKDFARIKKEMKKREDSLRQVREDSIAQAELDAIKNRFPEIKYKIVKIRDMAHLREIRNKYNHPNDKPAAWKTIMTLNRKEWRYFRPGQTVIIPDTIVDDIRAYSVFPQYYEGGKDIPRLIMVSNAYQSYGAYENGELVRFVAVNSGKEKTPTFPGRYALAWKERLRKSSLDSTWIMPFTYNFHTLAGNAFHQFTMPGYPASHSCVRQFMDDAKWLFQWGRGERLDSNGRPKWLSGTPVVVIDHYDFSWGSKGPWLKLASNKDTILELPPRPMNVEEALIPIVQIPYGSRGRLRNRDRYENAEEILRKRGVIREHVSLTPTVNYNLKRRLEAERKAKEEEEKRLQMELEKQNKKSLTKDGAENPGTKKLPTLNQLKEGAEKNKTANPNEKKKSGSEKKSENKPKLTEEENIKPPAKKTEKKENRPEND